jgi:phosphodiesterase/alkaline phosphatase D-like protein
MMMRTALMFAIVTSIRSCFGLMEDLNLAPDFDHTPFLHGVASADPLYDRVLIWTRISPSLTLTSDTVTVSWAVWEKDDPSQSFDRPLRWNVTRTTANDDFTVTIDVMGLQQGIRYNYQFQDESGRRSIVGTTKTLSTDDVDTVRVAFLSCTSLWSGYFNFYRHLASDSDVDLVLHQGDFIYPDIAEPEMHRVPENLCKEWEWFSKVPSLHRRRLNRRALREEEADPVHFLNGFIDSVNCSSASILERYRFIYSLYMLDPDLRAARAQHPFVISLDNHDQYSYMSGRIPMDGSRKAAREWVPQRTQIVKPSRGQPFEAALRHFRMGKNLLDIILLDTYGYSGDADMKKEDGILGDGQHEWLEAVLHDSSQSSVSWRLFGSGKTFMPFVLNHLGRGFVLPLALVFLFLLGMTLLCIVVEMSSSDVAYLELPQKQTTGTEDTEGFLEPSTRRVMYVGWMTYVKETHAEALRWCTAWSITSLLMWTVICVSILLFARHKLNDSSHLKTLNPGIDEWEGQMGSMDRLFDQLEATGTDSNNFWAVGDMQ